MSLGRPGPGRALFGAPGGVIISGMAYEQESPEPATVLRAAYEALIGAVETMTDERSWLPTDCVGWAVRDLVFHCLTDAQRGLVALHTPADRTADRDSVTYWADWKPNPAGTGAASGRRFTRVVASMFLRAEQLRDLYVETAAAMAHAAIGVDTEYLVLTQGHVLTAGDLMRTLTVEATIHHLDLAESLSDAPKPSELGLAQVRRTLDGLLEHPVPVAWNDTLYARKATGRAPLTGVEVEVLGLDADLFPLFA